VLAKLCNYLDPLLSKNTAVVLVMKFDYQNHQNLEFLKKQKHSFPLRATPIA
jgi:hypothetical protein